MVRGVMTQRIAVVYVYAILAVACFCLSLFPSKVHAEGTVVVFFSGLCNSAGACQASLQAYNSITPKLTSGVRLLTPALVDGKFQNQGTLNNLLSSIGSDKVVFVAYSAGYNALAQAVNAMNTTQLKQVRGIASLEAAYGGFETAVKRVQSVNPTVSVQRFSSTQFGTNHSLLPGAPGAADAISAMATAAQNNTVADLSNLPYNPGGGQISPYTSGQQQYQPSPQYASFNPQSSNLGSSFFGPASQSLAGIPQLNPALGNTTPYSAGSCAPQFYCANNSLVYRSSTCVDQLYQTCPYGCSGNACSAGVMASSLSTGQNASISSVSFQDQLNTIARGPQINTTNSTTSPVLNANISSNSVAINGTIGPIAGVSQNTQNLQADSYSIQPGVGGSTFVSPDLASGYSPGTPAAQSAGLEAVLTTLKSVLISILNFLNPFGAATPKSS